MQLPRTFTYGTAEDEAVNRDIKTSALLRAISAAATEGAGRTSL